MKATLTTHDIADALLRDNNAGWSLAGAFALAEYLEEQEKTNGEEMELDVVAFRSDYSEYPSLMAFAVDCLDTEDEFSWTPDDDDEQKNNDIREYIKDHGILIEFDGGIIVSNL
jgi:hypothetical protein